MSWCWRWAWATESWPSPDVLATGWLLCFFDIECFFHQQRLWVGAAVAVLGCAYGAGRMARALRG